MTTKTMALYAYFGEYSKAVEYILLEKELSASDKFLFVSDIEIPVVTIQDLNELEAKRLNKNIDKLELELATTRGELDKLKGNDDE